jgi:hypothetical protein
MRHVSISSAVAMLAACVFAGCSADRPVATEFTIHESFSVPTSAARVADGNLGTHLSGDNEVFTPATPDAPTPADSRGQGEAIYRVNEDGTVDFKLIATNIDNITQAHIHCAPAGTNGSIRMWLYPVIGATGTAGPAGTGRHTGILASGTFNPTGITCPAITTVTPNIPAMPLLDAMRAGYTYTNVHTRIAAAPAPSNSGPGDFTGGEIRGQVGVNGN